MLPQKPEEYGYYTYGTPTEGLGQYAHPELLSFIFMVGHEWSAADNRLIGIGNISLAGGGHFKPHHGHMSGLEVDIRPLRKDAKRLGVTHHDPEYDRNATRKLIELFFSTGKVKRVRFNDVAIPRIVPTAGHDNHLHVDLL